MTKLIIIENTVVRQDAFGRYSLNDLHRAAVAQGKATESQRSSNFLKACCQIVNSLCFKQKRLTYTSKTREWFIF